MVNILSGGLHAEGGIEVQDFLAIPHQVESATEATETVWSVRNAVRSLIVEAGHRPLVADEGGFAPPMDTIDDAFDLLISGIKRAGYVPGDDVSIGIDVAASHFYDNESDKYRLDSAEETLTREEMIALVVGWTETYPVVSVEDPLAESDWAGWGQLADQLDDDVQLLGDDLLVTDTDRLHQAVAAGTVSAILVKPNQAGTISRAINVVGDAKTNEINPVVSARSGETCDATIADLAVGLDAGQIKIGSLARSERLVKYNRLLEIERTTSLPVRDPFVE
jgi:enolase